MCSDMCIRDRFWEGPTRTALGLPDRSSAHPAHRLDDDGLGKPGHFPMVTEMKTTNTKRIGKAMFQMKGLVSQKVSFPYTEWSHIYMFEDANPYCAPQTNSEGLTTPSWRRVTRATSCCWRCRSSTTDASLAHVRPRLVVHGRQVRLPKCPGQTARQLPR